MRRSFLTLRVGNHYLANFGKPVKIVSVDCCRHDLPKWLRPFARERYIDQDGERYRPCGKKALLGDRYGDLVASLSAEEYRAERYALRVERVYQLSRGVEAS
jgi:hypothetical protein